MTIEAESRPDRIRLPFSFDPEGLAADLARLEADAWIPHFVPAHYDGDWSILPLRAPAGATHPIQMVYPDPMATSFDDTPFLLRSPFFRAVLDRFLCPLQTVRLMRLTPGSTIKEHRDHDLHGTSDTARMHIPILTGPGVEFLLNGRPVVMAPGSVWYLRLADPHQVANRGDRARVHLVVDAKVNDWLAAMLR